MSDDIYITNNENGWAVFKANPTHHYKRPFAFLKTKNGGQWSLSVASYVKTQKEAIKLKEDILRGIFDSKGWREKGWREIGF